MPGLKSCSGLCQSVFRVAASPLPFSHVIMSLKIMLSQDIIQLRLTAQSAGEMEHGARKSWCEQCLSHQVQLGNARTDLLLFSLVSTLCQPGWGRKPCLSEHTLLCVLKPFTLQRQLLVSPNPCFLSKRWQGRTDHLFCAAFVSLALTWPQPV